MKSDTEPVPSLVKYIVENEPGGLAGLAYKANVSVSTIQRWLKGTAKPRPAVEGRLRGMAETAKREEYSVMETQQFLFDTVGEDTDSVRLVLSRTLGEVREILHRRGRLSSRQEALDEIAKLLFAHIMDIDAGGDGICERSIPQGQTSAEALCSFVRRTCKQFLPKSLSHEIESSDMELKLKSEENRLAHEITICFERLATKEAVFHIRNSKSVDVLNEVFGQFLADSFVDEKELGQYLTPMEVVKYMTRLGLNALTRTHIAPLCDPSKVGDAGLILDPSCGVGSFLAEAMHVLHDRIASTHSEGDTAKWIAAFLENNLVGIDKSTRMIRLAMTNLGIYGASAVNLHLANSLDHTGKNGELTNSLAGRASLILTNPPFGASFDACSLHGYNIFKKWASKPPQTIDSEILFMERYLEWLQPQGVLVAIVPDSILTNKGLFEDLRRGIAPLADIESVTSLPTVTFAAAGTSTKTSVLQLRKKKTADKNCRSVVKYAICNSIGYDVVTRGSQRTKVQNGPSDIPEILAEMTNGANGAFVRSVDVVTNSQRWDATFHCSMPMEFFRRLENPQPTDIRVGDVAHLSTSREDPRRRGIDSFQYIEISDVNAETCQVSSKSVPCKDAPSRARKVVAAGDVLVSTVRPERKAIGVVPFELDGAICSTGFAVLKCDRIAPLVLAKLLQTDFANSQLLRNNVGIAYPAIEELCLPDVVLPAEKADLAQIAATAKEIESEYERIRKLNGMFEEQVGSAIEKWSSR